MMMACVEQAPSPFVGDCADYPAPPYDFGEIGIGSCLAGPTDLEWVEHGGRTYLLVPNANPWLDFTGGNVVSIDIDSVPLDGSTSLMSEVAASSLEMPDFPGYAAIVPELELMLVPNRLSEEARTRVGFDDLYFLDVSDPEAVDFAIVGEDGERLQLMSDPDPVVYDAAQGWAYVANLTSHTVSVVDVHADPVEVVDAVDSAYLTAGFFVDSDGSGSRVQLADTDILEAEAMIDDEWTLTYAAGTWRVWVPSETGLYRLDSFGDRVWDASALGVELHGPDASDELGELEDPQLFQDASSTRMAFVDAEGGAVWAATSGEYLGDWTLDDTALLSPRTDAWDQLLGGPAPLQDGGTTYLFYDGQDAASGGIGLAVSEDGVSYDRAGDDGLVLAAGNGSHDAVRAADPFVIYDEQAEVWRMVYGAWDGASWTVGHATSPDLVTWTAGTEALFVPDDGADALAPTMAYTGDAFHLWTTRPTEDGWGLGLATSPDGYDWTDQGIVASLDSALTSGEAPEVALMSEPSRTWSLQARGGGWQGVSLQAGSSLASSYGYELSLSSGAHLFGELGPSEAQNGVSVGSWMVDEGRVYLTFTDGEGTDHIGYADWNDGDPSIADTVLLSGDEGSFDEAGVFSPVVYALDDGSYAMLYAGSSGGSTTIGLATSADGVNGWSKQGEVLGLSDAWDAASVVPGSVVSTDNGFALYYTGSDGERRRIGLATSSDGLSWTREEGDEKPWAFDEGAPGEFDDSDVFDPWVLRDDTTEHLWYAGSDGERDRIGYASRPLDGSADWERAVSPVTDEVRPALVLLDGSFDLLGARHPVVTVTDAGRFEMLYTGDDGTTPRVGLAVGPVADTLYRAHRHPTVGDTLTYWTFEGDEGDEQAISLEAVVDGIGVTGIGVSHLYLDPARGFLYVASKLASYIYVIDVRDDSEGSFHDNFLGVEALLVAETTSGATGFRGMLVPEGSSWLYAVNDSPESVMILDLSVVEDDDLSDVYRDVVVGYLPTPNAGSADAGSDTLASVGPSQLVEHLDWLFVANFNANTVGVYDQRLGNYGSLMHEIEGLGENPHALSVSPDGSLMAVANYTGDVGDGFAESSISLVDVDPDSPTWLQVVARVANR